MLITSLCNIIGLWNHLLGFVSARSHPCLHSMDILRVSGVQEVFIAL
ncbi:unnamed protein product [Brassica oleracea var. botrytis]